MNIIVQKKKDGTYLIGGLKNHIYQLYFDKYGFPEIISDVDTGYGYYEDDIIVQDILKNVTMVILLLFLIFLKRKNFGNIKIQGLLNYNYYLILLFVLLLIIISY